MNKKILVTILVGVFGMALVSAVGLMAFYGQVNANLPVNQPISLAYWDEMEYVDFTGSVFTETFEVIDAGNSVASENIKISNSAELPKEVLISELNSVPGIEVDYGFIICVVGTLPVDTLEVVTEEGTQISVPAGGNCVFNINYDTSNMLTTGNYVVKTRINPVA